MEKNKISVAAIDYIFLNQLLKWPVKINNLLKKKIHTDSNNKWKKNTISGIKKLQYQ